MTPADDQVDFGARQGRAIALADDDIDDAHGPASIGDPPENQPHTGVIVG